MRVRVEVAGDREVRDSLRRLGAAGPEVSKRVLARVTERIVPQAKALSPVDDKQGGQLRDSIRTTRPTLTSRGVVSAGVIAGGITVQGVDVNYAEMQHEDLTLEHKVGQGKFLEIPFLREAEKVPEELLAEIDKEAGVAR